MAWYKKTYLLLFVLLSSPVLAQQEFPDFVKAYIGAMHRGNIDVMDSIASHPALLADPEKAPWVNYCISYRILVNSPNAIGLHYALQAEEQFRANYDTEGLKRTLLFINQYYWTFGVREGLDETMLESLELRSSVPESWAVQAVDYAGYLLDAGRYKESLQWGDSALTILEKGSRFIPIVPYATRAVALHHLGYSRDTIKTLMEMSFDVAEKSRANESKEVYKRAVELGMVDSAMFVKIVGFAQEHGFQDLELLVRTEYPLHRIAEETELTSARRLVALSRMESDRLEGVNRGMMEHELKRISTQKEQIQDKNDQRNVLLIASGIILLVLVLLLVLNRRNKARAKAALTHSRENKAALESYKSRLRPHFVFNQLNNIYSFLIQERVDEGARYIGDLSSYLRDTMTAYEAAWVYWSKEEPILQGYANLQMRSTYGHVDFIVEPKVDTAGLMVPSGILQPLIENSFKYAGSAGKSNSYIKLTLNKMNNSLVIYVEDSGYGGKKRNSGTGNGLKLLKERLAIMEERGDYPGTWRISTEFTPQHSKVTVVVPWVVNSTED